MRGTVPLLLLALVCAAVAAPAHNVVMPPKELLRAEVEEMFDHAFGSYMLYAFPEDELKPLSCSGRRRGRDQSRGEMDNALGNYALTLIDSLDSLAVFGRKKDFADAVKYISTQVTIRVLGGLISGHILAIDKKLNLLEGAPYNNELLTLAVDLADRLLPAFNTQTGIPYSLINLRRGVHKIPTSETCLAGAGTLQLEFSSLSLLTLDTKYMRAAFAASRALWSRRTRHPFLGSLIDVNSGQWRIGIGSIGAGSDSFYEYLLKMHVLTGDGIYLTMWQEAYAAMKTYMESDDWYLPVNIGNGDVVHGAIDSLMAFMPGVQVLAGDVAAAAKHHLNFYRLWRRFGAMPENFDVRALTPRPGAHHGYPLRPEFIESTYYLYQATRDPFYLEVGWHVMQDINSYTRTKCGFAAVADVTSLQPWGLEDRMDSFFLSETLKYLYLLFDDDNFLNKGEYIFNTEGHPIPLSIAMAKQNLELGEWSEPAECVASEVEAAIALPKDDLRLHPARPKIPPSQSTPAPGSSPALVAVQLPAAPQFQLRFTDPGALPIAAVSSEVNFELTNQVVVYSPTGASFVTSPALFGPELDDTCIHADIALVTGAESCQPYSQSVSMRVVITERGFCNFIEKVAHAQNAGATAVLVCDTHEPDKLISMHDAGTQISIDIPSFFLAKGSCTALFAALQKSEDPVVKLERTVTLPFGLQLPFGGQTGIQLNSIISALMQTLPRLPQLDPTPYEPLPESTDSPPSSPSSCAFVPPPHVAIEACPWPDRVATPARPRAHVEVPLEFEAKCNTATVEPHEYIIAPPLTSLPPDEGDINNGEEKSKQGTGSRLK